MPQQVVIQIESGEITIGSVHLIRLLVIMLIMLVRQAFSVLLMSAAAVMRCEQLSNFRYRPRIYIKLKENLKTYAILQYFENLKHFYNFSMLFIGHAFIFIYTNILYLYPYYNKSFAS